MNPQARSEKPRYRRPSRAALSFETKETISFTYSPYTPLRADPSFVRAWGTTVFLVPLVTHLKNQLIQDTSRFGSGTRSI